MPIGTGGGRRGSSGILAMPGKRHGAPRPNFADLYPVASGRAFRSPAFSRQGYTITGVTKDSTGVALGGVTVQLFLTNGDIFVEEKVSDGSGNYSFGATAGPYYIVAYKVGAPDVAGTTVNTLTAI